MRGTTNIGLIVAELSMAIALLALANGFGIEAPWYWWGLLSFGLGGVIAGLSDR